MTDPTLDVSTHDEPTLDVSTLDDSTLDDPVDSPAIPWPEDPIGRAALAAVGDELLAIPEADVLVPGDGVSALVRSTLEICEAAWAAGPLPPADDGRLRRLETLALALERAHLDARIAAPRHSIDLRRLAPRADAVFTNVEATIEDLVRRGELRRRFVPRRRGRDVEGRAFHVLDLIRLVRVIWSQGIEVPIPNHELVYARRLAWTILTARCEPDGRPAPHPADVRNRAYTALRRELERARG